MSAALITSDWWSDLFSSVDAKDADRFASFLTADAEFRFGNAPAISGTAEIKDAVNGFFDTIEGSEHEVLRTWSDDGTAVCQGQVTYTRYDGSRLTLPFVNVFELRGDKIARYLIYIDIAPLYQGS